MSKVAVLTLLAFMLIPYFGFAVVLVYGLALFFYRVVTYK